MPRSLHQADALEQNSKKDVHGNVIPNRSHQNDPPQKQLVVQQDTDGEQLHVTVKHQRYHWLVPVGLTMCICGAIIFGWTQVVVPHWTHYQEQLACGTQHICTADAIAIPGQASRTFVSMIYNQRITIIEVGKPDGTDSHIYIGPFISSPNWQQITPQMKAVDVNNDGYTDLMIVSPDFEGVNPVLYNLGNGSFDWHAPSKKGN